jgi:Skp family chaperone for outer membrane proteins
MRQVVMKIGLSLLVASVVAPVVATGIERRATPPIAFVSVQRISAQSSEAKAAAAQMEKLRQDKARELAARQKALEATQLQRANTGGFLQSSKRAQLKAQEDRERADLQHAQQQAQTDLQNLQRQLQTTLRQKVGEILRDIAKQRHLQVVLNEDTALVWAPAGADLTSEVVERLNTGGK